MELLKIVSARLSERRRDILNCLRELESTAADHMQKTKSLLESSPLAKNSLNFGENLRITEDFGKKLKVAGEANEKALKCLRESICTVDTVKELYGIAKNILENYNNGCFEKASEHIKSYLMSVETAKRHGYWDHVYNVISKGHIGRVTLSLRQLTLNVLKNKTSSEESRLFTRLAVALNAGREACESYLSSVRLETRDVKSQNPMLGGECYALNRVIQDSRNILLGQAATVHSEFGVTDYIRMCREIHRAASSEASFIFMDFMRSHFKPLIGETLNDGILAKIDKELQNPGTIDVLFGDKRSLDKLLENMALISFLWIEFEAFLQETVRPVYETSITRFCNEEVSKDGFCQLSDAKMMLQSILAIYVRLEHVSMTKAILLAIEVADAIYLRSPEDAYGVLTSTLVDDVFFVLKKAQHRAIGTGDLQAACAVFNQVVEIIGNNLKSALVHNLVESQVIYGEWIQKYENLSSGTWYHMLQEHFRHLNQPMPEYVGSKFSFVHCLNNIEESLNFLLKFQKEIYECFSREFMKGDKENLLIENTIQALDLIREDFEHLQDTACKYALNMLRGHISGPLNHFDGLNFDLDEEKYSSYQANDPFVEDLIGILCTVFRHFENFYAPNVRLKCVNNLMERICKFIEVAILNKRFSIHGAVYFDGAIRSIMSSCATFDQQTRKQFVTLLRICDILNSNSKDNLEAVNEDDSEINFVEKYAALRTDVS